MIRSQYEPASVPDVTPEPVIPTGPGVTETPADPTMPEQDLPQDRLAA